MNNLVHHSNGGDIIGEPISSLSAIDSIQGIPQIIKEIQQKSLQILGEGLTPEEQTPIINEIISPLIEAIRRFLVAREESEKYGIRFVLAKILVETLPLPHPVKNQLVEFMNLNSQPLELLKEKYNKTLSVVHSELYVWGEEMVEKVIKEIVDPIYEFHLKNSRVELVTNIEG